MRDLHRELGGSSAVATATIVASSVDGRAEAVCLLVAEVFDAGDLDGVADSNDERLVALPTQAAAVEVGARQQLRAGDGAYALSCSDVVHVDVLVCGPRYEVPAPADGVDVSLPRVNHRLLLPPKKALPAQRNNPRLVSGAELPRVLLPGVLRVDRKPDHWPAERVLHKLSRQQPVHKHLPVHRAARYVLPGGVDRQLVHCRRVHRELHDLVPVQV